MSLLSVFATAILPIIAVAAMGFVLGRYQGIEADALNTVTVYVLAPALVVHSLMTSELAGGTMLKVLVTVLAFTLVMILVAESLGRATGHTEPLLGAFVLVSVFGNTGNYGIPLADFAFGPTGRSTAVLVTAIQGVLLYTAGVYIAARGSKGNVLSDMRRVFAVPLVYGVVVALAVRWLGAVPPTDSALMETLGSLGNASIPVMLLILGIQLSNVDAGGSLAPVGVASSVKLLLAPLVALVTALAIGFENPTVARVVVLLLATPTGVTAIILVGAFSGDSDGIAPGQFVSATVFVTTLVSVATMAILVTLLQSGVLI